LLVEAEHRLAMEKLREQDWATFEQLDEQSAVLPHVEIPVARHTELITLVLPAIKGPETAPAPDSGAQPASPSPVGGSDPTVEATLFKLREACPQQPGGGYASSDVGQALYNLGYKTPKDRQRFLQSVPGLESRGTGTKKVLVF